MEVKVDDIKDIYEARRIIKMLYDDMVLQYYGKVFYGCLSVITLIVGYWLGYTHNI